LPKYHSSLLFFPAVDVVITVDVDITVAVDIDLGIDVDVLA
jgi:hypothetical protein